MGAHVALRAATRRPELRAIVAIEPSRGGRSVERRRTRLALASRRTYASRDEAISRFQFLPTAPLAPEALRGAIAAHSVRQEADGRYGYKFDPGWFGIGGGEPTELSRIACPVLIVRGAESPLLSAAGAAEWINEIADAAEVEIPGGGHNVHIECPDEVLAAVEAFVTPLRR
jgi:pimeloyl-ACP methyl ester carboxylesterase